MAEKDDYLLFSNMKHQLPPLLFHFTYMKKLESFLYLQHIIQYY